MDGKINEEQAEKLDKVYKSTSDTNGIQAGIKAGVKAGAALSQKII